MPVFTVIAEEQQAKSFKLHNEAVKIAAHALATVERFRSRGYLNIRIYCETEEITLPELLRAIADESAGRRSS